MQKYSEYLVTNCPYTSNYQDCVYLHLCFETKQAINDQQFMNSILVYDCGESKLLNINIDLGMRRRLCKDSSFLLI